MNTAARVKIDLNARMLELEGSEEFVTKYFNEFKTLLDEKTKPAVSMEDKGGKTKQPPKEKGSEKSQKEGKKSNPKKIEIEEFEIGGDSQTNIPALKDFLNEKNATESSPKTIIAIGYYITHLLNKPEFSEGNIEFAYKVLRLTGRPAYLHQVMINRKNNDSWFESGSDPTHWILSRVGQLFVEESMPDKKGE